MKKFLACLLFLLFVFQLPVFAYQSVRSSVRKNGSIVQPHFRTSPNRSKLDNWSSQGNLNPFTGKRGYRKLY